MRAAPSPIPKFGERGQSLIEVMVSMAILLIGLLGALQGIGIASSQNSMANRGSVASVVAEQVRAGLMAHGFAQLTQTTGPLSPANCTATIPMAGTVDLTDGLSARPEAHCYVDLDAYDASVAGTPALLITPDYLSPVAGSISAPDRSLYRRVLVYFTDDPAMAKVEVVVSWDGPLQRGFTIQSVALYDPSQSGNQGGSQI